MKILLSNDDGFQAEGIISLEKALAKVAKITTVAPDGNRSATGHSITLNAPISVKKTNENSYATSGTPTDSVKIGIIDIMRSSKPDFVLSGVNYGGNIGEDITYSGTVAVAIEGALYGIPSIAVSLVVGNYVSHMEDYKSELHFDTASKFAANFVTKLKKLMKTTPLPKNTFFNINVPNLPYDKLKGVAFTSLGRRCYEENTTQMKDPYGNTLCWFTGSEFKLFDDEGTDAQAILNQKISVTPLQLDFSNYDYLKTMRNNWDISL
jgi:5'-nucleotidase